MKTLRDPIRERALPTRTGAVLVEFAFIALAFYLLFAGTLELGRMITTSQAIQNAARIGARELALIPLPPTATFQQALANQQVRDRIYDEHKLVIDVTAGEPNTSTWPIINRMLLPVMIRSNVGGTTYLHFPGAILVDGTGQLTVGVPNVIGRDANGIETIRWVPVLEEVRTDPDNPATGPFSLASTGPERGLVALRINCPYQATTLTAYRVVGGGPNLGSPVHADDDAVNQVNAAPGTLQTISPTSDPNDPNTGGFNTGRYGMGSFTVLGNVQARPFRRVISSQSLFRREVYAQ